jgi:membrane-bound metal-dependent hydrolase YbcI (DUF457 family)
VPVVGHAFVGAATALAAAGSSRAASPSARALWVPTLVGLAYLPDIPGGVAPTAWFAEARALGHSVLFVAVAGIPLGIALARWAQTRVTRGIAIAIFSMIVHDVLDILQNADRVPFWPFSRRPLGFGLEVVPKGILSEGVVFAGAFSIFAFAFSRARGTSVLALWPSDARSRLASAGVTAVVLVAAVGTQLAREAREADYRAAESALGDQHYRDALILLDRAEAWPSVATAGRLDYLRAEAYRGLGDTLRAEEHYLRSYQANPDYVWLVADLALFYAGSDRPAAERRRLVEPLVRRLREDFLGEEELTRFLARVDRRLAVPWSGGATTEGATK